MIGNPLEGILELCKSPTEQEPWGEIKCVSDEKVFSKEFVDKIDNPPMLLESESPFFFRGQSDYRWTLKPKLYRLWSDLIDQYRQKEKDILREALIKEYDSITYFQHRAYRHLEIAGTIPRKLSNDTFGEWLALMQHYSTPTRLLDWTTSFYVALYFAAQDDRMNGAVWFFARDEFEEAVSNIYEKITPEKADTILKDSINFVEFGMTANHNVYISENDIKTDRIISQRGIFTFSTHLFTDQVFHIGQVLFKTRKSYLIKLIIPANIKREIRKRLAKINITNETLFASIDSIGKTIDEKIQLFQDEILGPKLQNNETI